MARFFALCITLKGAGADCDCASFHFLQNGSAFCNVGLCFFTVSVLESSWEVGLGRAIPPNHTPNHTPEPYPKSYPLKNAKKNLQELWH